MSAAFCFLDKGGILMTKPCFNRHRQSNQSTALLSSREILKMLPHQIDFLVRKEQQKDHLRRMEQERLIREAQAGQHVPADLHRKVLGRVGAQLVKLGQALEQYEATAAKIKTA
jgi:hypothetical protein